MRMPCQTETNFKVKRKKLTFHTGPEQGRKMKETDAQVSQCHFFRVIEPDKTQKKVKKVSEPVFHNALCSLLHKKFKILENI